VLVADVPPWLIRATAILLGLFVGSFLNVVIVRVPREESVVSPGSHCICGKPISWYDNVPILSWLVLRGRARCCGARISPRYPLVEAIGALLTWAIVEVEVLSAAPANHLLPLVARAFVDVALALSLVAAAFIDLDHMYLPNAITIGGAIVALLSAGLRPDIGWARSALGLAIGFAVVWLPFIVLYRVLRGRPGMGLGDAKLLALAGAWFGWEGALFTLFAGAIQGTLASLVVVARKGKIEEPPAVVAEREAALAEGEPLDAENDPVALPPEPGLGASRVPFGPFLVLAALEFLLFGRVILERWFGRIAEP
jgi:leader peptidase (prepilin peptidase)/N-methyltransferase